MAVAKLTDLSIRSFPEGVYFDAKTPGFGILIGKRTKTWLIVKGRGRVRIKLGRYPELSLSEARRKALQAISRPDDPGTAPSMSFAEARDQFLSQHTGRSSTKSELKRQLTKHTADLFNKHLLDIQPQQIDKIVDSLRDRPSECLHFWKTARSFFRWTVRRRFLDRSPVTDEPPTKEKIGDRVLTDSEIAAIWNATADRSSFSRIVRLLLITAQRRTPIAGLRSEWITPDGFLFPASAMKAGKEFLLPVTPLVREQLPERKGFLFPARRSDRAFSGFGESKADLDRRSGVKNWTLHSLRRTAATNMGKLKVQPHIVASVLAHSWGGITARYNRFDYLDEKEAALVAWERRLTEIVGNHE